MSVQQDGYVVVTIYEQPGKKSVINVYRFPTEEKARRQQKKFREEAEKHGDELTTRVRPLYKTIEGES